MLIKGAPDNNWVWKKNSEHSAPDIHVTPVEELIKQVSTDENDILA